jgi:hypothetical protein
VQILHPPFSNGSGFENKSYSIKVIFNGMTFLLNSMKIYNLVQKLLGGHRKTGDLMSLLSFFKGR